MHCVRSRSPRWLYAAVAAVALVGCGGSDASTGTVLDGSAGLADGDVDGSTGAGDDGAITFIDSGISLDGHVLPDAPTGCGPDTCAGCCDSQHHCVSGADATACGASGNRCIDCASQSQICVALSSSGGACAKSAACGPHNCDGCCLGDACMRTFTNQTCGAGGEACTTCAAGEFCKGTCVHAQPDCGPSNCSGCCNSSGYCSPGTANVACGYGGQYCQRCLVAESTGQCVARASGGGACNGEQTCGPLNCLGCCDGNVCRTGTTSALCGANGAACAACATTEQCAPAAPQGGSCQTPPFCGPAGNNTCRGCCQGNACTAGKSDTACGTDRTVCEDCTASARICVNGRCIDPYGCNPATCSGCCVGALCAVGSQDIACGLGGGWSCVDCTLRNQHCSSGQCG